MLSPGGCKHSIAFLMWAHRESSKPAVTDVLCYWKKPALSRVGTTIPFLKTADLCNKTQDTSEIPESFNDNSKFLKKVMNIAKKRKLDCQLSRYNYLLPQRQTISLSIHQLLVQYLQKCSNPSADDFLTFSSGKMHLDDCSAAEQSTRNQSDNHIWFE